MSLCMGVHLWMSGNSLSLDGFSFFRSCRLQGQHNLISEQVSYPVQPFLSWLPCPAICAALNPASTLGYSDPQLLSGWGCCQQPLLCLWLSECPSSSCYTESWGGEGRGRAAARPPSLALESHPRSRCPGRVGPGGRTESFSLLSSFSSSAKSPPCSAKPEKPPPLLRSPVLSILPRLTLHPASTFPTTLGPGSIPWPPCSSKPFSTHSWRDFVLVPIR